MNFLNMINIGNNRGVFRSVSKICEKAPSYLFDRVLKTFLNNDTITMPLEVVLLFSLSTASTFCVNFPIRSSHGRCSVKKLFLKIFLNLQKDTCTRVSFSIKLQARRLQLYWITRPWRMCFPVNIVKFVRHCFYRAPSRDFFWIL